MLMFNKMNCGVILNSLKNVTTSMLLNQFVPPTFGLCFAFTGIDFRGMLHPWPMTETCVDQSELVDVGAQID